MATKILSINNKSDKPVAYVGKSSIKPIAPTGWAAWAFGPESDHEFGWTVETKKGNQALLTKKGLFTIWDDGNWNIKFQPSGGSEAVLVHVSGALVIQIEITVDKDGNLAARQV